MRLFSATLATETNTFSPLPANLDAYREGVFLRPGEHPDDAPRMCTAPLFVARRRAKAEDFTLIEGSCFAASPAGLTDRGAYEFMRDEILDQLERAMPIDGVILGLHGAMVAVGYEDVEGDFLERIRAIVGPRCVIGVEFDPHCCMTIKRVGLSDIIVCYKEYPHVDIIERAEELIDIVLRTLRKEIRPVMSLYDCRQIGSYPTNFPLMRSFVDKIKDLEGEDGILSISVVHGFPYADVPELSTRILVVANKNKEKADKLATQLGEELVSMRGRTMPTFRDVATGVDEALATTGRPVIIAEPTDNAGGGAPSDNTDILRYLIARQVKESAIGPIWDPVAVRLCFSAGRGARLVLRLGGKISHASGIPIDALVEIIGLARDCWQTFGPTRVPLGDCAAVRIDGVDAVLITKRSQALGLELFSNVGINPRMLRLVAVKSSHHFMASFGPIAKKVIYVESSGPLSHNYRQLEYRRVRRPIWPLDESTQPGLIF